MEYYTDPISTIVANCNSSAEMGLSDLEAELRLKKNGPNKILKTHQKSWWKALLEQFQNLLVILLIIAALLSMYLGSYRDGIVLIIIVIVNAGIGFYQNWKSENILASIENLVVETCVVIRNGLRKEIPVHHLVVGDIVYLQEGDGVPADLRLLKSNSLFTNDFILTGESQPKEKNSTIEISQEVALADRDNCVYMGTTIAKGNAIGLVIATAMNSELGKIANTSMKIEQELSPLQKEMDALAVRITYFTFFIGLLLLIFKLTQNESLTSALVFSIGVAAAMVPSGLPAQISIALSLGVQKLARRNAIMKKITAVETLGSATVIASDKTGTITKNEMTIHFCRFDGHDYKITGTGFEPKGEIFDLQHQSLNKENLGIRKIQFLAGYLASTARINPPDEFHKTWYSIGDPTEAAFATLAAKAGYNLSEIESEYKVVQHFPFDSNRKRISILRNHREKYILFAKGSIESILFCSTHISENGSVRVLTDTDRSYLLELATSYAANGFRIIASAYKDLPVYNSPISLEAAEDNLIFSGFVSMMDPPHDKIHESIAAAFQAGIRLVMITGDNEITASAIADQIGMKNPDGTLPEIINDKKLKQLSDDELTAKLSSTTLICSRVSPEEKLRIVGLLKNRGDVVAVTGDGVNDTLSLKRADIGISMGQKGSKIAQEASSLVLLDDNFSTIVYAIQEGRTIYHNIRKNIMAVLASNLAELLCVIMGFIGAIWNFPTFILAIHILLIDLIGEMLPLLTLSFDPSEKNVMQVGPRTKGQMVNLPTTLSILGSGIARGMLAIFTFYALYITHQEDPNQHTIALTGTMVTIILTQYVNILCMRSSSWIISRYLFSNLYLFGGLVLSATIMLVLLYLPFFQNYLHTAPLSIQDWIYPTSASLLYLFGYEIIKLINKFKHITFA